MWVAALPALTCIAGWLTEVTDIIKLEVARMPDAPCAIPEIFQAYGKGLETVPEEVEGEEADVQIVSADQLVVKRKRKESPARLHQDSEAIVIE
jgi:hypothetical protein